MGSKRERNKFIVVIRDVMHFPDGLPAARIMITVSRKQWIRYIWSCVVNWWLLVGDRRGIWWLSPRLNYYIILSTPTSPIPARRFIRRNIKQTIPRSRCWRKLTTCLQLHDHPTTCLLLSLLWSIITVFTRSLSNTISAFMRRAFMLR